MPRMFVRVIVPLPLHDAYTYELPDHLHRAVKPGMRVVVQFGSKKYYAALVIAVSGEEPLDFDPKPVLALLDDHPVVLLQNLELWKWMAKYYCSSLGDILKAALPPGLKLESKTKISLFREEEEHSVSLKEQQIIDQIREGTSSLEALQRALGSDFSYTALKQLLKKQIVRVEEKVQSKYKPRTETFVRLHSRIKTEEDLHTPIDALEKAKRQRALLFHFCEKTGVFSSNRNAVISKKELFRGTDFSEALLNELVRKKIVVKYQKEISRLTAHIDEQVSINLLNRHQEKALREIKAVFEKKDAVLIHGITASGKTEIYIHLIDETLKEGRQVLYLVPEIALTTQIVRRLKNVFGGKVGIYHSRLNDQERVEIWEKVVDFQTKPAEGYQIILGARSALFMPFSNLGLVIVDEEHEHSYKQFDPAPRYHARDMAVVLGLQQKAKILLGSATPSFESYYNALKGKYGLVNLTQRHSSLELPDMVISDLTRAWKKKEMRSVLTPCLFERIEEALANREQVILFQNRRGYSPYIQCITCGWIPSCKNCDVSLTYHKFRKRLNCHYCGYSLPMPSVCPECGSAEIKTRGFGTEKIEDELKPLFPGARIDRMDMDTTHSRSAFTRIIHKLENRETDILIGTQMVTKGLDFEHVRVVGILNADNLMHFPDFRAHERAYQLISQVSGRAGRKHKQGIVIVQTSQPDHPLIELIRKQDYLKAFHSQMEERHLFKYPPFFRLIKLAVRHKKAETASRAAAQLASRLRKERSFIVLGPEFPVVSRIQLWYTKEIWIKINPVRPLDHLKQFIVQNIEEVKKLKENSSCVINIDVDPG